MKGDAGSDVIAGPARRREEEGWAVGCFPAWARFLPRSSFLFFFFSFLFLKEASANKLQIGLNQFKNL
jgi:hypothetical protein